MIASNRGQFMTVPAGLARTTALRNRIGSRPVKFCLRGSFGSTLTLGKSATGQRY
jgi:hypothetical protein